MKLYNYLNEIETPREEVRKLLFKDCKPYLDLLNIKTKEDLLKNSLNFYRSDNRFKFDNLIIKLDVKERKPIATLPEYFPIINKWLEKNKHISRNKSVSVSADFKYIQKFFGNPAIFFPIGKFNYTFIKASDFNTYLEKEKKGGWDNNAFVWLLKNELIKNTKNTIISSWLCVNSTKAQNETLTNNELLKFAKKNNNKDKYKEEIVFDVGSYKSFRTNTFWYIW